jgi:phosphatidylinositol glycan class T
MLTESVKHGSSNISSGTNNKREAGGDKRIKVHRIIRDSRQLKFYVETRLENTTPNPVPIHIIDTLPKFYDVLLNTYDICAMNTSNGTDKSMPPCVDVEKVTSLKSFRYEKCSYDGECFDTLSWSHEVPPNSIIVTSYVGLKQFMHVSVFPPDASRGIEIPPSLIYINRFPYERVMTSSHLISLPLSDFSMSFNVITLVSTSFVFLVGTMINTLVRKTAKMNK